MEFIHESILMVIAGMLSLTATAADWPQYGGPDGRWVADAGDHQYLQDWSKAKLVWTSETNEIGPGRGQAPRYGFRNADPKGINHWGGAASPVIADGVLFQVYLRPVGDVYNQAVVDKIANDKRHSEREGFSIEHLRLAPALALSGGERRRVEIARCLAANPKYLLLDEPFAGVDPISVGDIRHLVADLTKRGIGVLITDHNVRETLEIVDRAYILHDGTVIMSGSPKDVVDDENVRRVYLGHDFRIS